MIIFSVILTRVFSRGILHAKFSKFLVPSFAMALQFGSKVRRSRKNKKT